MLNISSLKEDDSDAPPIILSHLQKCKIIQTAIYNHHDKSYTFEDDDLSSIISDLDSDDKDADGTEESSSICESDSDDDDDTYIGQVESHEHLIPLYNYTHLSAQECEDIYDTCIHLMNEYIMAHPTHFTNPSFHSIFEATIYHMVHNELTEYIFFHFEIKREINYIVRVAFKQFFRNIVPIRSYPDARILLDPSPQRTKQLTDQINILRNKPQPAQRTPEWYNFRNNLITASNAYKIWESDKMQNSIIYEKCKAMDGDKGILDQVSKSAMFINVSSPLHWGQKYEPMSVLIYEDMYRTKIEDFGCIGHDTYSCVGASPDGINVDQASPRYGRMLEIKNIVNREINGIPKKEYWVQMQLQMEVCGLDECDFFESRFVEYESYNLFKEDRDKNRDKNDGIGGDAKYRGLIIYFTKKPCINESGEFVVADQTPIYEYCPPTFSFQEMEEWEETICGQREKDGFAWVRNIYWKLEEFSCVLVCRNRIWFRQCVGDIENIWKIIEKERETGYAHREPTRRAPKEPKEPTSKSSNYGNLPENVCFIKVNKI